MTTSPSTKEADELEKLLEEDVASFYYDPLGFVLYAFEWGEGELKGRSLRKWQRDYLIQLGEQLKSRNFDGINPVAPVQISTASGHGIGKSALVAMIILFIMSTRPNAKGIVTANTSDQLRTKTWAELGKWHKRCITGHWFEWRGGKGGLQFFQTDAPEAWRCDGMTCKEENSEAFAGLHAADSTPFYIFDEASAVPDKIFEVAQGGLTDGEPIFLCFGNPTRNTGFFRFQHGKFKHRWICLQIDSRNVEGTNKELFKRWIEDYGEDSDYVRVRVKGQFPRASSMQFIDNDSVAIAMRREAIFEFHDPLTVGIDVARGGEDSAVIYPRRGLDARTIPFIKIPGELIRDSQRFLSIITEKLTEWDREYGVDAVFVDSTGVGGPLADQLRKANWNCYDVGFGETAPEKRYSNWTAYMMDGIKQALKAGLALPNDNELEEQLTTREYWHNDKSQLVLERKDDVKDRGFPSPDIADGLALTFAMKVGKREDNKGGSKHNRNRQPSNHVSEERDSL